VVSDQFVLTKDYFNMTIHSDLGISHFINATLSLTGGVKILWDNSTNTFSKQSDPSNYVYFFTAGECFNTTISSTDIMLTFKLGFWLNYTGWKGLLNTTAVYDDTPAVANATENLTFFYVWPATSCIVGTQSFGFTFGMAETNETYFDNTNVIYSTNINSSSLSTVIGTPTGTAQGLTAAILYLNGFGFAWLRADTDSIYWNSTSDTTIGSQIYYPNTGPDNSTNLNTALGLPTGANQTMNKAFINLNGFGFAWMRSSADGFFWNSTSDTDIGAYYAPWSGSNFTEPTSPDSPHLIVVTSTLDTLGGISVFTLDSVAYATPQALYLDASYHTYGVATPTVTAGGNTYQFNYWVLNGSTILSGQTQSLNVSDYTTLQMNYGQISQISGSGVSLLWQYLLAGDFVGFIFACYTSVIGQVFYAWISTLIGAALYIRLRNIAILGVIWILIGSILIPAMPLVSPLAIFLLVIGIATVLYKLFQHTT